ncbi:MAG: ACP S-malonyltransferase [Gammaproteobacteria bacterium]|jgi:[acyl-carrier-protein] S-malonyltransferase|nr:ACP S-malonyltransferase [Gammaproteobacteria bacterium]MBT6586889.1 ACP S-malonyltransferase [Gammaproteobacteria bacterium]MDG1234358.1 ACP S-malonyltransferase [Pseudomonadales bacterium]
MTKLAFVFPGQGSQAVGMLEDAREASADLFAEASSVLGYDLWNLVENGPEDQLNQTEYTQPALLTASIALFRLAQDRGLPSPDVVAGHSLGEYSALVAANVLQFSDAVMLVQKRGQFMQTAVPLGEGGMAAVLGLDDDQVREVCIAAAQGEVVQAVNYNSPGQVVIAGNSAAIERAIEGCKQAGARRAIPLSASAPFHSELMKPAAEELAGVLNEVNFAKPTTIIVQNIDAASHDDPEEIRTNLIKQMYGAVLWTDSVRMMKHDGISTFIECGPGKVLTGLSKRIDKSITCHSMNSAASMAILSEALVNE